DDTGGDQQGFQCMLPGRVENAMTTPCPGQCGDGMVKGLARSGSPKARQAAWELPAPWPKAKCVDAGPFRDSKGGYSPMTVAILTDPVRRRLHCRKHRRGG